MFVTDVKYSQATWQTVPNSRTGSAKASASGAVVRTAHTAHMLSNEDRGDRWLPSETRWISLARCILTTQCLTHKTDEASIYELYSAPNWCSTGVMWSRCLASVMGRAVAFCNDWALLMMLSVTPSDLLLTFLDWPAIQLIAAQLSVSRKSRDTRIPLQAAPGSRVEMLEMLDKQRFPVIII